MKSNEKCVEIRCTKAQEEVITHHFDADSLLNVIAGPGSGKTKTLVDRVAYALSTGIKPNEIFVFSLTNSAVEDFQRKVAKLVGIDLALSIHISTFHSFCYKLVTERHPSWKLLNPLASLETKIVKKLFGIEDEEKAKKQYTLFEIKGTPLPILMANTPYHLKDKIFFSKIVYEACDILKGGSYLSEGKLVIIDEFQDVSSEMMELILLISKGKHLTVVGDIDQSIYDFTGANADVNWGHLKRAYSGVHRKDFALDKSFRLPREIIVASRKVIGSRHTLMETALVKDEPTGVVREEFSGPRDELEFIYEEIDYLMKNTNGSIRPSNIAILSHFNDTVETIKDYFENRGKIPVQLAKDKKSWSKTKLSVLLFLLRLMDNPHSDSDLLIIARYINKVGPVLLKKVEMLAKENQTSIYEAWHNEQITKLRFTNSERSKLEPFFHFLDNVRESLNKNSSESIANHLIQMVRLVNLNGKIEIPSEKIEQLFSSLYEDLVQMAAVYSEIKESIPDEPSLLAFFNENYERSKMYAQILHNYKEHSVDAVTLSTLHSAKGLEWDIVFITTSLKTERAVDIYYNRNLLYVGATRAKHRLYLNKDVNENLIGVDVESSRGAEFGKHRLSTYHTLDYFDNLQGQAREISSDVSPFKWGRPFTKGHSTAPLVGNLQRRGARGFHSLKRLLC